jgi:putative hemolysin
MPASQSPAGGRPLHGGIARLEAHVVRDRALIRQAQALRYRVLAQDIGRHPAGADVQLDEDRFDPHCEHLVMHDIAAGRLVATYRLLAPDAARRAGGYAAEDLFELGLLDVLRGRMVELGRVCVHPEYRCAAVSHLLWSSLARYLLERGHDYVLGCVTLDLADGGHTAASVFRHAASAAQSPDDLRVLAHLPLPLERLRDSLPAKPPALLAALMGRGAWVCGAPGLARDFARAELPLLLPLVRMRTRNARQFLANAA